MARKSRTLGVIAFLAGSLTLAAQEPNKGAFTVSAERSSLGTCQIFGQIFGNDPLAGEMLVEAPSGDIGTLRFDRTTVFAAVSFEAGLNADPIHLTADALNVGDWICADVGGDVKNAKRAATVLVARREEIQKQQRAALTRWLRGGVFGTVND